MSFCEPGVVPSSPGVPDFGSVMSVVEIVVRVSSPESSDVRSSSPTTRAPTTQTAITEKPMISRRASGLLNGIGEKRRSLAAEASQKGFTAELLIYRLVCGRAGQASNKFLIGSGGALLRSPCFVQGY